MRNVLAIILGGGRGTRLYPLTKRRAKPAVPLAGKYRLIDIPVSNCINPEIQKMYVLTQFNSASLNRHLVNTYRFSPFSDGFVDVLAAEQTAENPDWFQGTADAGPEVAEALDLEIAGGEVRVLDSHGFDVGFHGLEETAALLVVDRVHHGLDPLEVLLPIEGEPGPEPRAASAAVHAA